MTPLELERFEQKYVVEPNSGCWLWDAAVHAMRGGYGYMKVGSATDGTRRNADAHRLSYEHFRGPVPDGMSVLHRCDVPACVNPDHLFVGTHADNMRDMAAKNRSHSQRRPDARSGERNGRARLSQDAVLAIRAAYEAGATTRDLATQHQVHLTTVQRVIRGTSWARMTRPPSLSPRGTTPRRPRFE